MPIKSLDNLDKCFEYKVGLDTYLIIIYIDGSLGILKPDVELFTVSVGQTFTLNRGTDDFEFIVKAIKIGNIDVCEMPEVTSTTSSRNQIYKFYTEVVDRTIDNFTPFDEAISNTDPNLVLRKQICPCDNSYSVAK